MDKIFVVEKNPEGDNWQIANFGKDDKGNEWWICINTALIGCNRVREFAPSAKKDAQLAVRLLNKYFKRRNKNGGN